MALRWLGYCEAAINSKMFNMKVFFFLLFLLYLRRDARKVGRAVGRRKSFNQALRVLILIHHKLTVSGNIKRFRTDRENSRKLEALYMLIL